MSADERLSLFHTLRLMQVRHWPAYRMWVHLRHPDGVARVYRDGSFELC